MVVTAPELGHSAQDNFMLNIMASFAEFERELIAARIADSRGRLKARHLRFAGGIPFGYDSDRRTKQLAPNTGEAAVIRWMFLKPPVARSRRTSAEAANSQGYRTKSAAGGGPWTARQVLATLRNPVYIGMLRDGDERPRRLPRGLIGREVSTRLGKRSMLDGLESRTDFITARCGR